MFRDPQDGLASRFLGLRHDPKNSWVLVDLDLREPVIRCPTRAVCREYQRYAGGIIVRTYPDRRRQ